MQSYMALQSCNDIWTLFECFPKRNKQASHLNVCLLLLRVLVCMGLKKIDFCCQLGTLTYHVRHCICSTTCARLSVPILQMVSSLKGFDLGPWHPPVDGSSAVVLAYPLLYGSRLSAQIISTVPYPTGWPLALPLFHLLIAVLHAIPKIPNLMSSFHSDSA